MFTNKSATKVGVRFDLVKYPVGARNFTLRAEIRMSAMGRKRTLAAMGADEAHYEEKGQSDPKAEDNKRELPC